MDAAFKVHFVLLMHPTSDPPILPPQAIDRETHCGVVNLAVQPVLNGRGKDFCRLSAGQSMKV
jgi:hypothetical protein